MDKKELNDNNNADEFGFNFVEIIRILDRQKKIFYLLAIITLSSGLIYSLFERVNNPIYKGYFSMLVEDPFKKNEGNNRGNNFIEDIASYNTKNDIPTIIDQCVLRIQFLVHRHQTKIQLYLSIYYSRHSYQNVRICADQTIIPLTKRRQKNFHATFRVY